MDTVSYKHYFDIAYDLLWQRAHDHAAWKQIMEMAVLQWGHSRHTITYHHLSQTWNYLLSLTLSIFSGAFGWMF